MPEIPLPPKVRAVLYVVASALIPIYGVLQVSYANTTNAQPVWLTILGVVVAILGPIAGVTAFSHVPDKPAAEGQ